MQDELLATFCNPHFCYGLLYGVVFTLPRSTHSNNSGGLGGKFLNHRSFCPTTILHQILLELSPHLQSEQM